MKCSICKEDCDVVCIAYASKPFIDGRIYDYICFCCSQTPKTWEFDENTSELILYGEMNPDRLCSIKDMMEDGFSQREAETSLRAIRRCLKNAKTIIISELPHNIYDHLFLRDEPLGYETTNS